MLVTLTSSGAFLVLGVSSFTRWGTGSDRGTVATAADAQRWAKKQTNKKKTSLVKSVSLLRHDAWQPLQPFQL